MALSINCSKSHSNNFFIMPEWIGELWRSSYCIANAAKNQLFNPSRCTIPQGNNPALKLYVDVLLQIFKNLSGQDIRTCELVCKYWNRMLNEDRLWQGLLENHFPGMSLHPSSTKNFRNIYHTLHTFYLKLTKGVYASHTLHGHGNMVSSLVFFGGVLFSSSWDHTVRAWDIKTGKCIAILQGHGSSVSCLAVSDDGKLLFSGSCDGTIKFWEIKKVKDIKTGESIKTYECIATLQGHRGAISCLDFADGKLFSGGCGDNTIKVWDVKTGKCIEVLQGQESAISSLKLVDGKLFSGSRNGTIKIWDIKTGKSLATFQAHTQQIFHLAFADGKLFSSSYNDGNEIKVWNIETGKCIATLRGHRNSISGLIVTNGKLLSGSLDDTIKIWDIQTNECIATLRGYGSMVSCLTFANGKLFLGSLYSPIKILDFAAEYTTIFYQIVGLLKTEESQTTQQALQRFSNMPPAAKSTIYKKLYEGCKEDTSHNPLWQSASPARQAQAIMDYLKDQPLKLSS